MTPSLRHLALLGLVLPSAAQVLSSPSSPSPAPGPSAPARSSLNHMLVFLDAAHGGDDTGARIITRTGEQLLEKDITVALASRIRSQLSSLGLTTLMTREPDAQPVAATATIIPTPDQRAGLANHVHPFACIVLHATGAGNGVHLITSALPVPQPADPALVPWDEAQGPFLQQSDRLAAELQTAIARTGIPVHISHATIRPLDSLTCPAVLIELAPNNATYPTDSGYQARVAQAVATSLLFWRGHAEPDTPTAAAPSTGPAAQ